MSDQFWLKLGREKILRRGFGVTQLPADVAGSLSGRFEIDPLTGYATPRLVLSMGEAVVLTPAVGAAGDWLESAAFMDPDGQYRWAWSYREPASEWALEGMGRAGCGMYLAFLLYAAGTAAGRGPLVLEITGSVRVEIDGGMVTVIRNTALDSRSVLGRAQLWEAEEWTPAAGSPGVHYLYIYAVGERLCLRRVGGAGRAAGVGLAPGLSIWLGEGAEPLPAARLWLRGRGYVTVGLAREQHEEELVVEHRPLWLPEPTDGERGLAVSCVGPAEAVGLVSSDYLDEWGARYDGAEPAGEIAALGWRVAADGLPAVGPTAALARVRLTVAELRAPDGLVGTDLMTLPPAGINGAGGVVARVELRRGSDPDSVGLTAELLTPPGTVAPYVQPRMLGEYRPGGVDGLRFLTTKPTLGGPASMDRLTIEAGSGHQVLKSVYWTDAASYGGQTLGACYRAVLERLGLAEGVDFESYADGFELPAERADGEPALDFRAGQTGAEILGYLRETFAQDDYHRWEADGVLRIVPAPAEPSGVRFVWATPAAEIGIIAGGAALSLTIRDDWAETWDEEGLVNDVWVIGADVSGAPICAVATDWAAIRQTDHPAYAGGQFLRMTIIDGELQDQATCNYVARAVLNRLCRPRLTAGFTSWWVPALYEGDIVEIEGRGYWRVVGWTMTDEGPTRPTCRYEVEYLWPDGTGV